MVEHVCQKEHLRYSKRWNSNRMINMHRGTEAKEQNLAMTKSGWHQEHVVGVPWTRAHSK